MLTDLYPLDISPDYKTYHFISSGPKGDIFKMVRYSVYTNTNIVNMGFGDYDYTTATLNDRSVTNNGDTRKVLATVVSTLFIFTNHYPNAIVFARGSTPVRTRLYQMGIAANILPIESQFTVRGFNGRKWERFQLNTNYRAFSAQRKLYI